METTTTRQFSHHPAAPAALRSHALVFLHSNLDEPPSVWAAPDQNPYALAAALRAVAEQLEVDADKAGLLDPAARRHGQSYRLPGRACYLG